MKIRAFFLMFFCFISGIVFSQETENKEIDCSPGSAEYTVRYLKLRAMYVKMLDSEATKKYLALSRSFNSKAGFEGIIKDKEKREVLRGNEPIKDWVLNNIEKTDFKNCAEAEALIKEIEDVNLQIVVENKDLYIYMGESLEICKDISSDLLQDLAGEYGRNFRF